LEGNDIWLLIVTSVMTSLNRHDNDASSIATTSNA